MTWKVLHCSQETAKQSHYSQVTAKQPVANEQARYFCVRKSRKNTFWTERLTLGFVATNIQQNLGLNYIKFVLIIALTEKISC